MRAPHSVFEELPRRKVVVNTKKSKFFIEETHFLGHIVSKDGVQMALAKVYAIANRPDLRMIMMCKVFLDFVLDTSDLFDSSQRLLHLCTILRGKE